MVADRVSTDLKQHFDESIDYIDEAKRSGGGVLVHCFVGRSRRADDLRQLQILVSYHNCRALRGLFMMKRTRQHNVHRWTALKILALDCVEEPRYNIYVTQVR
ncbi:dual specificity protein phosphatase 1 [Prunus dulcis]|uniref:protein-tyrosine-phosphatase n=1 Tax=Prunus dulcis TaxID=3755 RepID=A0A4Y1QN67_PRUDU|nr:dual specificity protein phosphatase 1 [Prunus dulcis]